ncbi:MAG: AGE family epimerase/isomerase [Candidatus Riflebacteria bacterium]|nr:AGE family epimerase/isomerase [Candidatus Riflebacteria bacterium]
MRIRFKSGKRILFHAFLSVILLLVIQVQIQAQEQFNNQFQEPCLFETHVSDLFYGTISSISESDRHSFFITLPSGKTVEILFTDETSVETLRNLDEAPIYPKEPITKHILPGRHVSVLGLIYADKNPPEIEARKILFLEDETGNLRFMHGSWWINQIKSVGDFYLRAQFPDGKIDYTKYRTNLRLNGSKVEDGIQEACTISRLIYGFASAYMLTGEDRFLEAAEKGTDYLRTYYRKLDRKSDGIYWIHALNNASSTIKPREILTSGFKDDLNSFPLYEQIYALAGPVQTLRITGDSRITSDVDKTLIFMNKYYRDEKLGGYFSHIDPVKFSTNSALLGKNRSRKNWNSIGDHAPAYLINYYLAHRKPETEAMLNELGKCITEQFPTPESSPFVMERFHADWTHDKTWFWQKNRGVVGHNFKIAWNLSRLYNLKNENGFIVNAEQIFDRMKKIGADQQRGGSFDVMERELRPGDLYYRHVWHDRKVWWQQEQSILSSLIIAGMTKKPDAAALALHSMAFYNSWFLDHEDGGIYYHVTAQGIPYLRGDERQKGSHSMSGYHSMELCFLAASYLELLINKEYLDLYFCPRPDAFGNKVLHVSPDILPKGTIKIDSVLIEGKPWTNFDSENLNVFLPDSDKSMKVKVRISAK